VGRDSGSSRKKEAGGCGRSGGGEAPGGDLGEAVAPLGSGGRGCMRVIRMVALTSTLKAQGETARAGVSGVGRPESPASRHRSLRGANPGVFGLPRPDHTAVHLSMFFREMDHVLDSRDRLRSERSH
jgi:hypothetical protein